MYPRLATTGLSWVATAERLGVEHTDVQRAVRRVRTVSGRLEGQDRPQV